MALTNHERVGKGLDLLREGLKPFVERELEAKYGKYWITSVTEHWNYDLDWSGDDEPNLDAAVLLRMMWDQWNPVFGRVLGRSERSMVSELRDARNKWAHQGTFSSDDAYRILDSSARLLAAVSSPQADDVDKMKMELLRVRFDEQVRHERRKSAGTVAEGATPAGLKPWRDVVSPHPDVAGGRYQQAEFAADLWQVHLGQGSAEYRDPAEFFRRTYLTDSLRRMLVGAARRLSGRGGDPVVQLQTNFGGGKTHSMLALYHLFSGADPARLAGIDAVMAEAGVTQLPIAHTAVLVGNKISPGNPVIKPDGTEVRTLWGELAWQLGGRAAFDRIRADDERGTSPGDVLREIFTDHGPCLILIDEWVAYARQLHDDSTLPAGSFETQFTFAQLLTESAKLAPNCLLVISLPASDTAGSPHTQADDVEVGGQRGREALDRLRNVIGRVESSWRPASAEEGFEIVRRRLFEPMAGPDQFKDRDVVARAFAELYRSQQAEFPPETRDIDYEKRIRAAYPIHPEIFDRLYTDWSTLVKFQRTRGVLRLMAAVIHSLWERGDRGPLILPASIPIDDPRVQFELTRYLSDNWAPIIERDVDGPNSLPLQLDNQITNLGKFAAARRVARTIYLGSAPLTSVSHRGLEDRRVKLGCVLPGETPAVFGDALRRLAGAATYLYQDGPRYWYSTQPTVTKLAEDRADQLRRDPDKVIEEVNKRLRANLNKRGDFSRVHPMPPSSAEVPDDMDARLVVLDIETPYGKEAGNKAEKRAQEILENRGTQPRTYRNTLVFLAADKTRLQDLDEAVRRFLAWNSILREKDALDLSPHQVRQADAQLAAADSAVTARLPETYQWLLVPTQFAPSEKTVAWQALRLSGQDDLAVRASKKLKSDELLVTDLGGNTLRMELDRVPLWRGNHVPIRQLAEYFASYLYLARLKDASVLLSAIHDGASLLAAQRDGFAFAEGYDEVAQRYRGLRLSQNIHLTDVTGPGLLVKPDVAAQQIEAERTPPPPVAPEDDPTPPPGGDDGPSPDPSPDPTPDPVQTQPTRYYGAVKLDPNRVGRDAGRVAEEIIAHLSGLVGAGVTVTLEIEADVPGGVPEHVVRIVSENGNTLGFVSQGFEAE